MKWDEPSLVEYEFLYGAKQRKGVARLGIPRIRKGDREWSCAFQVMGAEDDQVRLARGEDGLQALWIANAVVRRTLDRLKPTGRNGEAHEFVFPRIVTTNYGLEFHTRLCKFMDAEIKKEERKIRRKLAARKRPGR